MIRYLFILPICLVSSWCGAVTTLDRTILSSDQIFVANVEAGKKISTSVDVFLYQITKTRDVLSSNHKEELFCIKSNAKLEIGGTYLMFANSSRFISGRESDCPLTLEANKAELSSIEVFIRKGTYYARLNNEDIAYPDFPAAIRLNQSNLSSENEDHILCLGSVLPFDDLLSYVQEKRSQSRK